MSSSAAPTKLRVGYIQEMFAAPILQLARSEWGQEHIELVEQPSGTGQVLTSFDASQAAGQHIDVAIALTEALIAGIAKGRRDIQLVGSYIRSSLLWAVITGAKSQYNDIKDLKGTTIGISRVGSGSQLMASVMALQNGWTTDEDQISFKVNDSFQNLRDSVNQGTTSAFMWETFTTAPYFHSGEVRRIGIVPTPWPSWSIATSKATTLEDSSSRALLDTFLDKLQETINNFSSASSFEKGLPTEFMLKEFPHYKREDVESWLETARWVGDHRVDVKKDGDHPTLHTSTATVSRQTLATTLKTLQEAGVLQPEQAALDPSVFVDPWGNGKEGRLVN
ncbi:unnamed protein product [Sympodiomycopsis kandeliae]